jgi:hypothetical protein
MPTTARPSLVWLVLAVVVLATARTAAQDTCTVDATEIS